MLLVGLASAICDVCTQRGLLGQKDYSTPFDPATYDTCGWYASGGCCSAEIAAEIAKTDSVFDTPTQDYQYDVCYKSGATKMSDACANYFKAHQCFYACDVNLSKHRCEGLGLKGWVALAAQAQCLLAASTPPPQSFTPIPSRKNEDCDPEGTSYVGVPLRAKVCDAWFEACKTERFCVDRANDDLSYFAQANVPCTTGQCELIGDIYAGERGASCAQACGSALTASPCADGHDLCEVMWGDRYTYDNITVQDREGNTVADLGYELQWTGAVNPNDAQYPNVGAPAPCPDHAESIADAGLTREGECGAVVRPKGTLAARRLLVRLL